jgi:hypothetical protein
LAAEDVSMVVFTAYEGLLSWLFLQMLLIAIPAVAGFLVGRRGRLHLWHVAALVILTALLLLPAVVCVDLNSRPEAWLSVMRMHASSSPGVSVLGRQAPGWATMVVALSLGSGLGLVLFLSSPRDRPPGRRPFATPANA